jgi:hypothetical protein
MLQAPKELEAFGQLQRQLGEATMQAVCDAVPEDWREVYVDMRSSPDGTSRGMKLLVVNAAREVLLLRPTPAILDTLQNICEMRAQFSPPWYGMRLAMTSEGKCEVRFSPAANCYDDPAFRDCQSL